MNRVEERLLAAYQAAAGTVTQELDPPDLAGSWSPGRRPALSSRRGSRGPLIRLAAPLAAAAAVAAVAVTLSLISASGPGPVPQRPSGPVPWRLPAAASVRQGYPGGQVPGPGRPRYYLGVQPAPHGPTEYAFTVYVYNASTGQLTGRLTLPGSGRWARAVASLGKRGYVVAATRDEPRFGCRTWLYQFRLTAAGKPAGLRPFVVPQVRGWAQQLGGSGDGQLAVLTTSTCVRGRTQPMNSHDDRAMAISLPSGAVSTWSPWPAASNLVPENVAFTAPSPAGPLLPFVAIAGHPPDFGLSEQAAYVMLGGRVGGPPARRYHLVVNPPGSAGVLSAVLSPDGRVAFVLTARRYGGRWHEMIGAYATATGKLLSVLASSSARYLDGDGYLIPDPSGRHLLVLGFGAGNTAVLDVATHRMTVLPARHRYPPLGAAW